MEATGASNRPFDIPFLHVGDDLSKQGRDGRQLAPTQVPALKRLRGIRRSHGDLLEILPPAEVCENFLGARFGRIHCRSMGSLWDRNQDMPQKELGIRVRRIGPPFLKPLIHLAVTDLDLTVDLTGPKALLRDFASNLLQKFVVLDAFTTQRLT